MQQARQPRKSKAGAQRLSTLPWRPHHDQQPPPDSRKQPKNRHGAIWKLRHAPGYVLAGVLKDGADAQVVHNLWRWRFLQGSCLMQNVDGWHTGQLQGRLGAPTTPAPRSGLALLRHLHAIAATARATLMYSPGHRAWISTTAPATKCSNALHIITRPPPPTFASS